MTTLAEHLKTPGQIASIPTDTVYGVVARAADPEAVSRLYTLKHREAKPGTIVAATIDQLVELGVKRRYLTAVAQFWPGAVSVIIPCGPELAYIHQGVGSLAFRIPTDTWLLELLEQTGPLLTSSANQPGQPPATTVAEAKRYFDDQIEWYEDGGEINREPSTVIRMIDDAIEIVRLGAVKIDEEGHLL
jgi:tRNA threonylcarbamoyl adenosine modification protein (Sua5/YciO/YrdC/YwlC family)